MRVIVLHDAIEAASRPDETDVLVQARAVAEVLEQRGDSCALLPVTLDLAALGREITRRQPDLVFNLVESVGGYGRLIYLGPALLDALRVPYTGAPTDGMFLTSSKVLAKRKMRDAGLPTPPAWHSSSSDDLVLPGTYLLKPVWEDASVGIDDDAIVTAADRAELESRCAGQARKVGGEILAESFIDGREFNLSLLEGADGPSVLPPGEIDFLNYPPSKPRIVGYAAKWDPHSMEYHQTPRRFEFPADDAPLIGELSSLALACWRLFGLRGYARVDFRVDESKRPWVLEVNANPGLAPDAGFPAAAAHAGLSLSNVVEQIVAAALREC